MNITLYQNKSDPRVVSKDITSATSLSYTGTARDVFDVMGGDITIATPTDISHFNYCYIQEVGRYYYITDIKILRDGVWALSLKIDVLMTYAAGIRSLTGTVDRNTNIGNGYIPDAEYQALCYSKIVAKAFPNAMTNDSIILMTIG